MYRDWIIHLKNPEEETPMQPINDANIHTLFEMSMPPVMGVRGQKTKITFNRPVTRYWLLIRIHQAWPMKVVVIRPDTTDEGDQTKGPIDINNMLYK